MNIKKQPFLFVLAVSIFVMLSHGVIPHHHHNHSIILHEENSCNEEEEKENEHEEPFHCHAFNDTDWFSQDNSLESSWQEFVFLLSITDLLKKEAVKRNINYSPPEPLNRKQPFYSDLTSRPPPFLS